MAAFTLRDDTEIVINSDDYVEHVSNCFLCDHLFNEWEEPMMMFENRYFDDGHTGNSLASILSSALSSEIQETTTHSKVLCASCKLNVLEYEAVEQRFSEIRYQIIKAYNETAKRNDLSPVATEINGVLCDGYDLCIDGEQTNVILEDSQNIQQVTSESVPVSIYDLVKNVTNIVGETQIGTEQKDNANGDIYVKEDAIIENLQVSDLVVFEQEQNEQNIAIGKIDNNIYISEIDIVDPDEPAKDDDEFQSDTNALELPETGTDTSYLEDSQPGIYRKINNLFYCELCSSSKAMPIEEFKIHINVTHGLMFYVCQLCCSGYMSHKDLEAHIEAQHADNTKPVYSCKNCLMVFANYSKFNDHKRSHILTNRRQECTICHKRFASKNLLDEHMNTHTGNRPYKCEECEKSFASKYSYQLHSKIHTDRKRSFQCDQCDKAFMRYQNLRQHKRIHSGIKPYICEVCSKAFSSQHNLGVHKVAHSDIKPYVCNVCEKAFARRTELKDHERVHTGERPFVCDICTAAFAQRSNLMSHKKSTHFNEKFHVCQLCNRGFKRKRLLDYHIQAIHTGERPHKCEICGAGFVYPEHFKKHMLIHTLEKPFVCEVCGKQFNNRDNRNAHRFVHSSKKPYECMTCGLGFMRKPLLLAHMKQSNHVSDTIIVNQPLINDKEYIDGGNENSNIQTEIQYLDIDEHSDSQIDNIEHDDDQAGDEILTTEIDCDDSETMYELIGSEEVDNPDSIVEPNTVIKDSIQFEQLNTHNQESFSCFN